MSPAKPNRRRQVTILAVKFAAALGLLWYLISDLRAEDPAALTRLMAGPIDWSRFVGATLALTIALAAMILRWLVHVRVLAIRASSFFVIRTGLFCYVLDFAAVGVTGSDVARAILLGRSQPRARLKVVASVLIDRLFGFQLFLMFVSAVALYLGLGNLNPILRPWLQTIVAVTAASTVGLLLILSTDAPMRWLLARSLPEAIARPMRSIADAMHAYRSRWQLAAVAAPLTFLVIGGQTLAYYLAATALPAPAPSLAEQALIVPLSALSNVIPLPANGLGLFDYAMTSLAQLLTDGRVPGAEIVVSVMAVRLIQGMLAALCLGLSIGTRPAAETA